MFNRAFPLILLTACTAHEQSQSKSEASSYFQAMESNETLVNDLGIIYSPALDLVSAELGWFVGETEGFGVIYKTQDGGRHWEQQKALSDNSIDAIAALDASVAWVSGNAGYVARTLDGGQTWTQFQTGFSGFSSHVSAVDQNHAWVLNDGIDILKTVDGGQTWSALPALSSQPYSVMNFRFVNSQQGFAAISLATGTPEAAQVFTTADGGQSWQQLNLNTSATILSLTVMDAQHIALASSSGEVYSSNDGGKSFLVSEAFSGSRSLGCFQFVDENTAYLAADDEVFVSLNGGKSWTSAATFPSGSTDQCDFTSPTAGLFLGAWGALTHVSTR